MKALVLYACALVCAAASRFQLPECRGGKCVAREFGRKIDDGWFSKDYLVEGMRMSVAIKDEAIRWTCWGNDPTSSSAPRYSSELPLNATVVELINCDIDILSMSYQELFKSLTLSIYTVTHLNISNRPRNIQWPSMEDIQEFYNYNSYKNEKRELAAAAAGLPNSLSLRYLSLHGTPMTTEQLISIRGIWTLTLVETGLTKLVNLSEFSKLHRLELHESMLEDAQLLGTAPALEKLVLHASDAGLTPMPLLRAATFLDVYVMGSIFGHCQNLEELAIDGGELDRIPERWLAGCTNLSQLYLTRLPNLRSLPEDLLSDTTNLQELDLSYNSLESLPEGLFSNVKELKKLILRNNFLKALPSYLLRRPTGLRYICVSHNDQALDVQLRSLADSDFYYNVCEH